MYDYNLTEYDILEMTDEDYLNYCKDNYKYNKKWLFIDLVVSVLNLICGLHAMYVNYLYSIPGNFICCGFSFSMFVDRCIESKRWKREIIRFMKFEYDEDSFRLPKREKILNFLKEVGDINDNSDNN